MEWLMSFVVAGRSVTIVISQDDAKSQTSCLPVSGEVINHKLKL